LKRRSSSSGSWLAEYVAHAVFARSRPRPIRLGLAVLCLLFAGVAACLAAPADVQIAGIRITGNSRTGETAVLNTFALESGKTYPYSEIRAGLDRIYGMGFFDDVRLYLEALPDGQQVTIEVVERPAVTSIKITGNKKVGKDDVRGKIAVAAGSSLDGRLIYESLAAIKALYKQKGFYLAAVTSETSITSPGAATVTFKIEEGVKVKVNNIVIEGNKAIADRAIRKAMETKPKRTFRRKQDFSPDKYDGDVDRIVRLYKDKGYINAKVVSHESNIDQATGTADLTITVDEGRQYYVKGTSVEVIEGEGSEGKISRDALARGIVLQPGLPYNLSAFEKSLDAMNTILGDQGYVYAEIEPVETYDGDSLSIAFKVTPRRAVLVDRVIIEGNDTTFEKVIRRELLIKPGDILRRSLVERSHREVFNLGYFDNVEIGSRVANDQGDVDLVFKVKERRTGVANVGAGYSEEFGMTGFITFAHDNMGWFRKAPYLGLGKGQSLNLSWEFGKLTQIDLGYRNPWFLDTPTLVGVDIYNTRREYDTYTDKRDGFGLVGGRRFPLIDYSRLYLRYDLQRRRLEPDSSASEFVKSQAGRRTTSSARVSLIRDSVDNPFFPRQGSKTDLEAEFAGGWLGGSVAYQNYSAEASDFIPVPLLGSTMLFRVHGALIDGLGSRRFIPAYERFRLGGTTTEGVRGYDDREIVPEGNAEDVGGQFMLTYTYEYRVPVIKNQAFIRGFLDAGDTWNSVRNARPGLLRTSVGLGFMISIPMVGQIGLDLGYGFDREAPYGGPGWKTHFQFGMSGL
jgi:outer membrane protein insertion porin family